MIIHEDVRDVIITIRLLTKPVKFVRYVTHLTLRV